MLVFVSRVTACVTQDIMGLFAQQKERDTVHSRWNVQKIAMKNVWTGVKRMQLRFERPECHDITIFEYERVKKIKKTEKTVTIKW
jgi:hypothetical protein